MPKLRRLSGSDLKLIALVLMVLDHIYQSFYFFGAPFAFRVTGRLSAPIFLFLLSEGFIYTRSRKRYLLRLLVGFWCMRLCSSLIVWLYPLPLVHLDNSIFGTMAIAIIFMWLISQLLNSIQQKRYLISTLYILSFLLIMALDSIILRLFNPQTPYLQIFLLSLIPTPSLVEGGWFIVLLPVGFYLLRNYPKLRLLPLGVVSLIAVLFGAYVQSLMIFAALPLACYHATQNPRLPKLPTSFFYLFYPLHLYLFYFIHVLLFHIQLNP